MPRPFRVSRLPLALLLGASLLTACGGEDSAKLVAEARAKLATGDYKAAMIQLKNAVAKDDKNAEARFELGKLYLAQLDLASAEKEFRRAREAGLSADSVNPMIARALIGQHEYQRVLDELPAPADGGAGAATMLALRATAELGLGHKEDARKTLQRAQQAEPNNAEVHLVLAQLALADGDSAKAMQDLDQALRIDPNHRESLLLKGSLLRATGKPSEATAIYREVLRIAPGNINARLALADIAIAGNKLDDARKEVDAALKASPNSLQARYTQALIDFREKKTDRARDHLAAVLKTAPDFLPAVLLSGAIEYSLGNLQSAETSLNKVVQAAPRHPYALRLLAATQLRLGRPDDAAATISVLDPEHSNDAGVHVIAGEIALAKKEWANASAHFGKAAQISPESAAIRTELGISRMAQGDNRGMDDMLAASNLEGGSGRADVILILNQFNNRQFDAALTSIATLEKKLPASPVPWNFRGAAYLGKKDLAKARDSFEQALKLDPKFFPAAANLAQLDLKDNQPAVARGRFESILRADPRNLQAMLALAELARANRDEKTYLSWLEKAAAASPQALQPRMLLSRYWLAKGDTLKAVATAREAVDAQPNSPVALDLLGTAQFASKDLDNALGTFRKLADQFPGQATPRLKLAQVQIAMKNADDARRSLLEAIRLQPGLIEAQLMLGGLDIQSARYDDAMKLAKQIQQQKPDSAAGFILEGDTALAKKQYPAAVTAFERAHKLAPTSATLIRLHQALAGAGRVDEGDKRLADWLAAHPEDHGTRFYLADSLNARGQYKAAADQYLLLNQQVPGNFIVLNNLASALSQLNDNRALTFAEQAMKLKPDNPAIMDTLGWILVQQGQSERGIKLLLQALSKVPDAAEINYHLAAAYAKSGDRVRARQELKRLLDSGRVFPQEKQAQDLLKQLGG